MGEGGEITIVVPVWNGEKTIRQCVLALLGQSTPASEIIVIDDGSTDGTGAILREFGERVRVVSQPNRGPAAARNAGIRAARGELIAFTDSDCFPDQDWLASLQEGFRLPGPVPTGGVGGIVRGIGGAGQTLTGEYVDLIRLLDPEPDGAGEIPYLITANACFARKMLEEVGLFDEGFRRPGGEEAELGYRIRRAGYHFRLAPAALVWHRHRENLVGLLGTLANYGAGAARIGQLWPEQRIARPGRRLLRQLAGLRSSAGRFGRHRREYGLEKALYFTLLDHLRQPAFLWGYRREARKRAGQRDHSLL